MPFHRDDLSTPLATLAGQGVFLGTSSWKYPGWQGMLDPDPKTLRPCPRRAEG